MSKSCKDCKRLNPTLSGTGPARPQYNESTLYDHMDTFQRFKRDKAEEEKLTKRREDLTKFDPKFTNWKLAVKNGKEEFDELGTQDIARFRQQVRAHNCSKFQNVVGYKGDSQRASVRNRTLTRKASLLTISRTPVVCPISTCGETVGSTSVLSHFLRDHSQEFGVQCQELHGEKQSVLIFDVSCMDFRNTICLGVLAYGGLDMDNRPAERGICMYNSFLPQSQEHLNAHMPILIMACKTSWSAMLRDKGMEAKVTDAGDIKNHVVVLWLTGVQTTRPITCTISIFDKAMLTARSTMMEVMPINETQDPSEFLQRNVNFVCLCMGEMDTLSEDGSECIHMEIVINEFK